MAVNLPNDYYSTRKTVRDVLEPYNFKQIKEANKAMKQVFGNRLSRIRATGSCKYAYYISCYDEEDQAWELDSFTWDFLLSGMLLAERTPQTGCGSR